MSWDGRSADIKNSVHQPSEQETRTVEFDRVPFRESTDEIDIKDLIGSTPLMVAAAAGRLDSVKLLVGAGADPTLRNAPKSTAHDLAVKNGHPDVARLLNSVVVP